MDNYLKLFWIADDSDSEITEQLKEIETVSLKELDNYLKKEFKEKNFFIVSMTKEEELIRIQIVSQYLRLIGLELLEREK